MTCLLLNCLVVSGMIIVMSLTLHSSPPIVSYSSHLKLSLLSRASLLYNDVKPTLEAIPNVSLFSFHKQVFKSASKDKKLQQTVPLAITPLPVSMKPINYPQQPSSLNNFTNKDIGNDHQLAKKARRSSLELQNNTLLAQHQPHHVSLNSNYQQMSKKQPAPAPPPSVGLANRPYVVNNPIQHISSQRKLSSQNIALNGSLSQQPVNWTQKNLVEPIISRSKVVDDTINQFSFKHDVLPLVAFIDTRPRYQHQNSTVILVQVRDVKRIRYNRIIGCGVDNIQRAKSFRAKPLFVYRNWIHANVPNLTHSEAVVNCYDLPSVNGSKPFVLYRPFRVPGILKVYSERPVIVTKGTMKPLSVVVCATVYDQPPWLSHWLRYQETLGVDHIRLYAQQSFLDKGGLEMTEVKRLMHNGLLEVDLRSTHLNSSQVCCALIGSGVHGILTMITITARLLLVINKYQLCAYTHTINRNCLVYMYFNSYC